MYHQYHPTTGLMQILHFNWPRYYRTVSNSSRVAKLAQSSVTLSFVLFPNKYFFNLHLLTSLSPFLSDQLGDTKTIRPFALEGHGSITHLASPRGLLTRSTQGLRVRVRVSFRYKMTILSFTNMLWQTYLPSSVQILQKM